MLTDQELQSLRNLGNEAEAAADEVARLRAALKQANDQAERFERGWYLRGDAIEALLKCPSGEYCDAYPAAHSLALAALKA